MAMENKRIIQLNTERTTPAADDYVMVDSATAGTAKYLLPKITDAIDQEISDRTSADTALQTAITNEATARTNADTTLQGNITAEATARAAADTEINTQVTQLKEDLTSEQKNSINFLALEQGGFIVNTGVTTDSTKSVRTITKIVDPTHIDTQSDTIYIQNVLYYNVANDSFVSTSMINASAADIVPATGTYAKVAFGKRPSEDITPADIQPNLTFTKLVLSSYDTESNTKALMYTRDATDEYVSGYINNSVSVGATVNPAVLVNAAMKCVDIPCRYGDKFVITGSGGQTGRLFAFTDENYRQLKVATSSETESNLELIAPANGHFISNIWTSQTYSLEVTQRASIGTMFPDIQDATAYVEQATKDYTRITDATLLAWKFGVFTSNGIEQEYTSGMLPNDRMYTIVKLKKGSTIKRKTFPKSIQVTFGYKLTESDSTLTDYASSASLPITIEQDCIAYIGVRYIPVELILNNEILSGLEFDLLVKDYRSMYDRGNGVKDRYYGWVSPDFYCEGQHVDTTGWTNSFSDVQAIHDAFDALATASNGYLTRIRDYGVVYTGNAGNTLYSSDSEWHVYEYETKQIRPSSAPKLPRIAITCCMHANEKMSVYAMHYLMYDLIHNATKNPVLSYLRNNCIINFIPICNPFGFMSVIPQRLNENGVNLNRNFPTYNWDEWEDTRTDGNGSEYGGQNYKGQSAGSETETKAMMSFYRNNYDAIFQIDLHTNGADTVRRDMISSTMLTEIEGVNYDIMHSYFNPAIDQCYRLKPWINEKYNGNITNSLFWGTVGTMDYYPSAPWWISESNSVIGMCYEVMAGSSNNLLGDILTPYSAGTIKMAAEQLANFIYMMLANCKDAK